MHKKSQKKRLTSSNKTKFTKTALQIFVNFVLFPDPSMLRALALNNCCDWSEVIVFFSPFIQI